MRHIRKFGGLLLITLMLLCVRGLGQEYVGTSSNRPSLSTSPRLLVGNILYETDTAAWRVWTGTAWVQAASIAPVGPLRVATSATRPTITNTPRLLVGDKLFESDTGVFRIWDGTEWKVLTFPGGSGETENAITQEDEFTVAGQFVKAADASGRETEPATCKEVDGVFSCGDGETAGSIELLIPDDDVADPAEAFVALGPDADGDWAVRGYGEEGSTKLLLATALDAYGDVTALWASGSCSGYLKSDGTCDTPSGGSEFDVFDRTVAQGIDEFLSVGVGNQGLYGVGSWNWLASGCIIGSHYTDSSLNRPGQVGLLRDTSGTCRIYLPLGEYDSTFPRLGNSANWEIRLAFNARYISDDSHKTYIAGLMYDASNNYGFYMRRQGGTDSNWQFVASKSGTTATGDTGISLGTGFLTLRIRSTAAGTIRMSVAQSTGDFGTEQTVCASGCDITFSPVDYQGYAPVFMITTDGAYNTGIGVDYVAYRVEVSR